MVTSGERNGEQRRTKISFWWDHDSSIGAAAFGKNVHLRSISEKIKPVAIAIIEFHLLKALVSQSVGWSFSRLVSWSVGRSVSQ